MGKRNKGGAPGKQERKNRSANRSEHSAISAPEQIERLDARLGEGVGAKKERAKLAKIK